MLPFTVTRHVDVLVDTIKMCISNPNASVEDCLRPTARDLDDIWGWNHELPPTYDFCMHEMISKRAQSSPDKVAISSWDGELTYGQIDKYSTFLACSLKEAGVELHSVVPACFEKSRWTIVAVLAAMKAGATFALMDPTLPLARLQNMAIQVGAKTMLTSRKQSDLSTSVLPDGKHIVVEEAAFAQLSTLEGLPELAPVPPSALMYIIFTSGSTGTPKGVTISHRTYTSSAIPRAKAVGYSEDSRVLDFASYAFDVSIDSMLLTTGNGGCLCIPSDEDRLNDINGVIRKMQVNYAGITPSVARILETDVIESLHGLGLGGEAASARDVTVWGRQTRIIIGYGPCECTIGCTVNSSAATGRDYVCIGTGNGAAIWIVDPSDHEALVPVGAVGELLVEGPIVGQGYLNDPEKTATAFVEDPSWLVAGHNGYAGRRGRLYKTGDLGKFDPDGSGGIVFAGRKDTQVKLRGQRVELGEIESQLRVRLPSDTNVIAEVIVPQGGRGQPTLVAFVLFQATKDSGEGGINAVQFTEELRALLSEADAELAKVVPRYMVPTTYIPVNRIPVLISGKTDRKRLRQFGQTVDLRQLDQSSTSTSRELSDVEQRLRQAWGQVLNVDEEGIRLDDNLFALGGDSLAAMKLVSVCRTHGLGLSVTSAFANPTLSAMAGVVSIVDSQAKTEILPFSMISQDIESARLEAALACGTDAAAVEDIYPSTPTQQALFTFALKSTKAYIAQRVARIPQHIDLDAWKKAWEDVVAANPILRSRLAQLQEPGLQQVVLKESITWRHSTDLAHYLDSDQQEKMELGQPLARYAIITPPNDSDQHYMVWTIHHVLYDGWSEPLVLDQVQHALANTTPTPPTTTTRMRDFVAWLRATDASATQAFWQHELHGAVGPQFPRLPSRDYIPTPSATLTRHIPLAPPPGSPFTPATLLRAAWALVASRQSGSSDVVFGETLVGRDIALPGVERVVGPLIATVPVRVRLRRADSVAQCLAGVQARAAARAPHQHAGFQHIRRASADAQAACETGTGIVIQPPPDAGVVGALGFEGADVVAEALRFNAYPVMLACGLAGGGQGGVRVCASFDKGVVGVAEMRRVLARLECACRALCEGPLSRRVGEIACVPGEELDAIWRWAREPPLGVDEVTGALRAGRGVRPGETYPRAVVPWVCDPSNPSMLSPIGCVGELWLEGAFLPGETVESPAWLVAGSPTCPGRTGRVQRTGDLVRLREDGSLEFVGRKDKVVRIQGHAVDIADFEAHLSRHLPTAIRAAASVLQLSSDSGQQTREQELVVFAEQPPTDEDGVELMAVGHDVTHDGKSLRVCAGIPVGLAVALKKLDKSVKDSLPPYMVPLAYVVVDKIPGDHKSLDQLTSLIPREVFIQLREGIKEAWTKTAAQSVLTRAEEVLQTSWAKILGISPEQIDVDDNFFRLGGDSVLAMKLVSSLRAQGHSLSVADIFQHMRLGDAAKVMKLELASVAKVQPYKPFSTLGKLDLASFISNTVRPKLADPSWSIQDVYPATDVQALDVRATIHAPRTSVQYTLLYFDHGVDQDKLWRACNELIKTHDILRTVFIQDGSNTLQVVLHELHAPITTQHADGDLEQHVKDLCKTDIEPEFPRGSPFLKIFHIITTTSNRSCLILRLSHAQYDGVSLPHLLQDLSTLYTGTPPTALPPPYSTYIAHTLTPSPARTAALTYWRNLLSGCPPTRLITPPTDPHAKALFRSTPLPHHRLPPTTTTATLLTAAWALVLARRLRAPDVTFASVTAGRPAELAAADALRGPCYQLTPVRVVFQQRWAARDLLAAVQRQGAEAGAHDWVGGGAVARAADRAEGWLDSMVHYQGAEEDVEEMGWAGGACRVGVEKPDGDAAAPFKAVAFVKGGGVHVGVVGSDRDPGFVEEMLGLLVGAVGELVAEGEGRRVLGEGLFGGA